MRGRREDVVSSVIDSFVTADFADDADGSWIGSGTSVSSAVNCPFVFFVVDSQVCNRTFEPVGREERRARPAVSIAVMTFEPFISSMNPAVPRHPSPIR